MQHWLRHPLQQQKQQLQNQETQTALCVLKKAMLTEKAMLSDHSAMQLAARKS